MPTPAIEIDTALYKRLQTAYTSECGRSPSMLINRLNQTFADDLDALRKNPKKSTARDLISDKTIRNFFNADEPQKLSEKNLNYLCKLLLNYTSFRDAQTSIKQTAASAVSRTFEDWLHDYIDYVRHKCNVVRIPNMTKPLSLDALYTEPRLAEELKIRKRKSITELQAEMEGYIASDAPRVEAKKLFKTDSKLVVWGAAGSGKSTSLRFLALRLSARATEEPEPTLPVFITLNEFSRNHTSLSFVDAIIKEFSRGNLNEEQASSFARTLLTRGKLVILLDSLDEIPLSILSDVQQEIDQIVKQYPDNGFVLTCRYGASDYIPASFKEVEMADFERDQVKTFVTNWFNHSDEDDITEQFLENLNENPQIRELTKNPLMLTMLCSIYSDGYEFPKDKSSLFEDATDLYLRKWDSFRRIKRDDVYQGKLSRPRRRDLFYLIAFKGMTGAEDSKFFWKRSQIERIIKDFIQHLPDVEEDTLDADTQAILNALESQHSLLTRSAHNTYTFSYRSFQEYFTAMKAIDVIGPDEHKLKEFLSQYAQRRDWRQTLLFEVERLPEADQFLTILFQQSLNILQMGQLPEVFTWLEQTTQTAQVESSSWRACYLSTDLETDLHIDRKTEGVDHILAQQVATKLRKINRKSNKIIHRSPRAKLDVDLAVIHTLVKDRAEGRETDITAVSHYDPTYQTAQNNIVEKFNEAVALAHQIQPQLAQELSQLQHTLPSPGDSKAVCAQWADNLQLLIQQHLNEGFVITLAPDEAAALNQYLYLVELIIDCLESDIYCAKSLRSQLLDSLLLSPNSQSIAPRLRSNAASLSVVA
ncbi:NACHT domain-containing protein [Leptothoe kymatousa]|uniref:NACHT domain-containing protein n=1 Tax=Leptothoe kymatousa TAU-MAC 1615 TaxID=2364775 RepID=A0ABS5Y7L3_9CYAN|nr:NACHT domain-containing protein [Leptothoe kymatousa]MBT9312940.1 NACHT domain-containing protein [Leptothoe kymatousa TAU-MAC 1615]